MLTDDGW
jgi:hypothetical protein